MKLSRRKFVALSAAASVTPSLFGSGEAPTGKLRLVFYTDLHTRVEWETPKAVLRCADMINERAPDLVVAGGDLITDGFQSAPGGVDARWDAYMAMHHRIKAPLLTCVGNHDLVGAQPDDGTPAAENARAEFLERTGLARSYGVHEFGDYRIFLLDSMQVLLPDEGRYEGRIHGEQLAWLEKELSNTPKDQPLIVVSHMPWLSSMFAAVRGNGQVSPTGRLVQNNKELIRMFLDHNLRLVLQGHLHVYERLLWRGTTYITGGAVCGRWWRGDYHGTAPGFVELELTPDQITSRYVEIPWDVKRPVDQ